MLYLVSKIVSVEPYKLKLEFNTGEIKTVDLEPKLRKWSKSSDSKFKKLLEADNFITVKYDDEMKSIYWDNGVDFSPNFLHELDLVIV